MVIQYRTTKHRTITESHNGSKNQQHQNHHLMGLSTVCDVVFPDHSHYYILEAWILLMHVTDLTREQVYAP